VAACLLERQMLPFVPRAAILWREAVLGRRHDEYGTSQMPAHERSQKNAPGRQIANTIEVANEWNRRHDLCEAAPPHRCAEEHDADVWLRIQGRNIEWLDIPTSVLTATLDAFRKGVQTVAEFIFTGRSMKRPSPKLKRACDIRLVAFRPGSLCVGIRLPDEPHLELGTSREQSLAHQALVEYLTVASWISSEDAQLDLEQRIKDAQKRRLLLNALKPLVPRLRSEVECVEISGRFVPDGKTIRLTRHVYYRLTHVIDRTVAEEAETYTGYLREIDLDRRAFILREVERVQQIRCTFEDNLRETARMALGRQVRVTGSRRAKKGRGMGITLHVSRLEVLDDRRSGTADGGHSA